MNREKTIKNIKNVFEMGYIPARKGQTYKFKTQKGYYTYDLVNCLGHACFNLRNETINQYGFDLDLLYACQGYFTYFKSLEGMAESMFNFVESVGLKVEKAQSKFLKKNEWQVALYFNTDSIDGDYHFLLRENALCWTSKMSTEENIAKYLSPPKVFSGSYDLYDIYTISNPHFHKSNKTFSREI